MAVVQVFEQLQVNERTCITTARAPGRPDESAARISTAAGSAADRERDDFL